MADSYHVYQMPPQTLQQHYSLEPINVVEGKGITLGLPSQNLL